MAMKKWKVGQPDKEAAKLLAAECGIDPFAALIACGRGITDPSELELMLSDEPILSDPYELADMEKAVCCINEAIENGVSIAVFGDYDCDGVVATALMFDYLSARGVNGVTYIPDRLTEGYGMNIGAIDYLKSQGVGLIITVDNGIACAKEIEYAKSLGIKTVVTDHHLPPESIPNAEAVIDPHRVDCASSFKEICGSVVAFKLICAVAGKEPEQLLYKYADLLAVATIGDIMPLVNENRCIVKMGIRKLKADARTGLYALMSCAGIDRNNISAGRISYGIVPRINVAGRMGSALRALKLLCCNDLMRALEIANELDDENTERQHSEREIFEDAVWYIQHKGYDHDRIIVVHGGDWHPGIVGIVASRIVEKFGRPAIILSGEEEIVHGSGRSVPGIHLYDTISSSSELLVKFGGHELAAGLSLHRDNIDEFRSRINEYAANKPNVHSELKLDLRLNPAALSVDMSDAVKVLEPFGSGNPTPVFGLMQVTLEKITGIANGKHLRLLFSKGGSSFQALLFGVMPQEFCFHVGDVLDLAVTLETNLYRDVYSLSIQIKAMRPSLLDEDRLFIEIDNYDSFRAGREYAADILMPSRMEAGAVYKRIAREPVSEEMLRYEFLKSLGFAKTKIAVDSFMELNLIKEEYDKLTVVNNASKTDLINSQTYKKLYDEVNKD